MGWGRRKPQKAGAGVRRVLDLGDRFALHLAAQQHPVSSLSHTRAVYAAEPKGGEVCGAANLWVGLKEA